MTRDRDNSENVGITFETLVAKQPGNKMVSTSYGMSQVNQTGQYLSSSFS